MALIVRRTSWKKAQHIYLLWTLYQITHRFDQITSSSSLAYDYSGSLEDTMHRSNENRRSPAF